MNDEKRDEHRKVDIRIYISLIIAAGVMAMILLLLFLDAYIPREIAGGKIIFSAIMFIPFALVAVVVTLLIQVVGLFICSWSARKRLLIWYGCLFALIPTTIWYEGLPTYSHIVESSMAAPFVAILLILPIIWLWKAARS